MKVRTLLLPLMLIIAASCMDGDDSGKKKGPGANGPGGGGGGGGGGGPGGPGGVPANPDDDTLVAPDGQIAIKVVRVRQLDPSKDLQIGLLFANGKGGAPVSLAPSQFRVVTDDGLVRPMSSEDPSSGTVGPWDPDGDLHQYPELPSALVGGERPDASKTLIDGYSIKLRLTFDLEYRNATEILFDELPAQGNTGTLRTLRLPVAVEAPTTCNERPTYLDLDMNNCGACGVVVGVGSCDRGVPRRDPDYDVDNCGGTGVVCSTVAPAGQLTMCAKGRCGGDFKADLSVPTGTCTATCAAQGLSCDLRGLTVVFSEPLTNMWECDETFDQVGSFADRVPQSATCSCVENPR